MKMRVKLYGTLSQCFPCYQHSQGVEVEIPDGATAKGLLAVLGISESQGAVVAMEGRILKADDKIRCGVQVQVFQTLHGG
jgi:sulfur carrier protein ThiS